MTFLVAFLNEPEWSVERICEEYNLTPAEVYVAWAFYYDHQTEIDSYIANIPNDDFTEEDVAKHDQVQAPYQAKTGKLYPDNQIVEE